MKSAIKTNRYVIFVILALLSVYPYVISLLLNLPGEMEMNVVFAALASVMFFTLKDSNKIPNIVLLSMFIQCLGWVLFSFYHDDSSYYTRLFFIVYTFFCLAILSKKDSLFIFGQNYSILILIQALLGVVAFILVYIGILGALAVVARGVSGSEVTFFGITCSNAVYGSFIRVAGFFDEPGALATWGVFILVINKLVFDNRKIEIGLLISLLFTFSAAFFVLMPLYVLCFYHSSVKNLFLTILLIVIIGYVGYSSLKENDSFLWLTTERFQGGEIRSKRDIYAEQAEIIFKDNILMGVGSRNIEKSIEQVNDNRYEVLAKDGVVGYVITYLPLFLIFFKFFRNKKVVLGTLILFVSYQQRPFHINEMHFFMLYYYMAIICIKYGKGS